MVKKMVIVGMVLFCVGSVYATPINAYLEGERIDAGTGSVGNLVLPGELSRGSELRLGSGQYGIYWIGANDLPEGTYYVAVRLYSGDNNRDVRLFQWPNGFKNDNSGLWPGVGTARETDNDGHFHWYWATNDEYGYTARITIDSNTTDWSLQIARAGNDGPYIDAIAFMASDTTLPDNTVPAGGYSPLIPVPEPATIGLMLLGLAGLIRRK